MVSDMLSHCFLKSGKILYCYSQYGSVSIYALKAQRNSIY